jgi:hypothetical protein
VLKAAFSTNWRRIGIGVLPFAVGALVAAAVSELLGEANAGAQTEPVFDPASEKALSYVLDLAPPSESFSRELARVAP